MKIRGNYEFYRALNIVSLDRLVKFLTEFEKGEDIDVLEYVRSFMSGYVAGAIHRTLEDKGDIDKIASHVELNDVDIANMKKNYVNLSSINRLYYAVDILYDIFIKSHSVKRIVDAIEKRRMGKSKEDLEKMLLTGLRFRDNRKK